MTIYCTEFSVIFRWRIKDQFSVMLLNIKAMETCTKSRINIKSGKHSLEHVLKIVVFLFARGVEQAEVDGCLSLCQGC